MPITSFGWRKRGRKRLLPAPVRLLVLGFAAVLALLPAAAWAHPMGNFTINRYSRIEPGAERITVVYIVDMAEIPALQERQRMDANHDGAVDAAEQASATTALADAVERNLTLAVDQAPLPLAREQASMSFPPGQGGLTTLRLETRFSAAVAGGSHAIRFKDANFADRIGWSEVVVRGNGAEVRDSSVPAQDKSNELRNYPTDLLQAPPSVTEATFNVAPAAPGSNPQQPSPISTSSPQSGQAKDAFSALITAPLATPGGVLLVLGIAFGLGAAHALAPGHGKAIVAAYLVGTRSNAWHAAILGLTTTVTHTAGVFALGLITLFVSRFVLPERLYPWLGVLSGVMVVALGFGLLRARWRSAREQSASTQPHAHQAEGWHSHGFGSYHSHAVQPVGAKRMPLRSLLMLGISGGLIPCPSALVVLLGAIALNRVGFGLLLIVIFSIGLASVLTLVGLVLVYARRFFETIPTRGPLLRLLPVASAVVVVLAGVGVTAQALMSAFRL